MQPNSFLKENYNIETLLLFKQIEEKNIEDLLPENWGKK